MAEKITSNLSVCSCNVILTYFNILGDHMQGLHKIERSNVTWNYSFDIVNKILVISVFYNSIHVQNILRIFFVIFNY